MRSARAGVGGEGPRGAGKGARPELTAAAGRGRPALWTDRGAATRRPWLTGARRSGHRVKGPRGALAARPQRPLRPEGAAQPRRPSRGARPPPGLPRCTCRALAPSRTPGRARRQPPTPNPGLPESDSGGRAAAQVLRSPRSRSSPTVTRATVGGGAARGLASRERAGAWSAGCSLKWPQVCGQSKAEGMPE